ncbi:MAG: hypothetical protein QOE77_2499 [Blastocatellia bacterium]|jgi:hypothetical protein|nr:hypothetical protein [Blastocatellia bacterium]
MKGSAGRIAYSAGAAERYARYIEDSVENGDEVALQRKFFCSP